MDRRRFLTGAAALGGSSALGCDGRGALLSGPARDGGACSLDGAYGPDGGVIDPTVEVVAFDDEAGPFGVSEGAGLDGRLYTDLSRLDGRHLVTANDEFYVRTRYPDGLDPGASWSLALGGLVSVSLRLSLDEVLAMEGEQGVHLLECSGNFRARGFGLMSAAVWHGVPLVDLLALTQPLPGAARVLITGSDAHSRPSSGSTTGAAWILSPEQLAQTGSFIATRMNGAPLPLDHGYPLRLFNPGWYGCSSIKWVQSIEWVSDEVASTSQMIEFAGRTHQQGTPALARDYASPEIQQSAMPIRIERWRSASGTCHRVVGIVWGGREPVQTLGVSFDGGERFETLAVSVSQNRTWSLWELPWSPAAPGRYDIVCRVEAPEVPMRRLSSPYYRRSVVLDSV